jgi:hypothetical protein
VLMACGSFCWPVKSLSVIMAAALRTRYGEGVSYTHGRSTSGGSTQRTQQATVAST